MHAPTNHVQHAVVTSMTCMRWFLAPGNQREALRKRKCSLLLEIKEKHSATNNNNNNNNNKLIKFPCTWKSTRNISHKKGLIEQMRSAKPHCSPSVAEDAARRVAGAPAALHGTAELSCAALRSCTARCCGRRHLAQAQAWLVRWGQAGVTHCTYDPLHC